MSTTIRQVMTASPHTIGRGQTMDAAHQLMRKHRIRHLPVLEGGRLVGVVSVGDLHLVETLAEVDPRKVTVEEAMTPDPYTVSPDAAVRDVAAVMAEHRYGCAIVVEGTHVRGVFTTVDALRALVDVLGGRSLSPRPVPRAPARGGQRTPRRPECPGSRSSSPTYATKKRIAPRSRSSRPRCARRPRRSPKSSTSASASTRRRPPSFVTRRRSAGFSRRSRSG